MLPSPLLTSGVFFVGVASRATPSNPSRGFWSCGQTIVAGISVFGKVIRNSGLHEFHSCPLCCKVLCYELFRYSCSWCFLSLMLVPEVALLQSLPKVHGYT